MLAPPARGSPLNNDTENLDFGHLLEGFATVLLPRVQRAKIQRGRARGVLPKESVFQTRVSGLF